MFVSCLCTNWSDENKYYVVQIISKIKHNAEPYLRFSSIIHEIVVHAPKNGKQLKLPGV